MKSMTSGSPLKHILMFALPLLLGNLFQQTYNMVDAAIVGQTLGTDALAALGSTSSVQFLVLGFCMGICAGFAIPIAQFFGAEKYDTMRKTVFNGGVLSGVISIAMAAATVLLCSTILRLLQVPANIFDGAYQYLSIIFAGIPFTILYNYLSGVLRSIGDSKTPFYFLAMSAVLNIFLDLFCIVVLHWGVAGAAIATIFSQAVSGILCLILIKKKFEILHLHKEDKQISGELMSRLVSMGIPMGLQYSITAIGSMVMQASNNALGSIYVSGFTAGMKIKQFMICPYDALATSLNTFVSQNYGAGKADRIKKGMWAAFYVSMIYAGLACVIMVFAGRNLSMLFVSGSAENADLVLDASAKYLARMGLCWWVLGLLNEFRNGTQALGYSGRAVVAGAVEMVARITVSLLAVPVYGFDGITWCDQAAWASATLYLIPIFIISYRSAVIRMKTDAALQ